MRDITEIALSIGDVDKISGSLVACCALVQVCALEALGYIAGQTELACEGGVSCVRVIEIIISLVTNQTTE